MRQRASERRAEGRYPLPAAAPWRITPAGTASAGSGRPASPGKMDCLRSQPRPAGTLPDRGLPRCDGLPGLRQMEG
jgi:hypothetical protein